MTNGLGPAPGCRNTADCAAWLATCSPQLADEDGISSSIIALGRLAGGSTTRRLAIVDRTPTTPVLWDGVTVELWNERCEPVRARRAWRMENTRYATFKIPGRARWMTVVPSCRWLCMSFNGVQLSWELR